jgi:hypothetical protein
MTTAYRISDTVQEILQSAFVDEHDLLRALRNQLPQELPDQPGRYRCRCSLAVRRPLDPETMEMRELVVYLLPAGDEWEVYGVEGLDLGPVG